MKMNFLNLLIWAMNKSYVMVIIMTIVKDAVRGKISMAFYLFFSA